MKQHHTCSVAVLLSMPCKMLLWLFLLKTPQEQLGDVLAPASLLQPLIQITHRMGNCQDIMEDTGKYPLANGHNAMIKLTGLAYVPSVTLQK